MQNLSPQAAAGIQMLVAYNELVTKQIINYFDEQAKEVAQNYPNKDIQYAFDILKDYTLRGGKRVRGSLIYYVAKLFNNETFIKNQKALLDLGVIMELLQTYLLIIDDFMDKSPERRGKPTGHLIFADYFTKNNFSNMDALHFGNSIATNTGLIAAHMAQELLSVLSMDSETIVALGKQINNGIKTTGYGQILDVINSVKETVIEDDIMHVHTWKTAHYTFENPMQCGRIAAGFDKDEEKKHVISSFAIPMGIAFQVHDDILGIFGNVDETGKSATGDLEEGKKTLLIQKALENGTPTQKEVIHKYLGKKSITESEHAEVKKILEDTGSYAYSKQLAIKLVKEAQDALIRAKQPWWDQEAFDYLIGISSYTIEREK